MDNLQTVAVIPTRIGILSGNTSNVAFCTKKVRPLHFAKHIGISRAD